jgi:S-(hydroxymethyl)mycothiol dehydrogenase
VIVGVPAPTSSTNLSIESFYWNAARLQVSWYGDSVPSRDFPQIAEWYQRGALKLDELVTSTVSLSGISDALARVGRPDVIRTVINELDSS